MSRNLKALGLALIAALALSAIAAQGAMAVDHSFGSEASSTVITADNDGLGSHVLSVTSKGGTKVSVTCTTAFFSGTQSGTSADLITLHPTFGKPNTSGGAGSCTLGGLGVTVTTTGCNFIFESDTSNNPATGQEDATTSVECEAGKSLKSSAGGCTVSIAGAPNNQNLHGVTFAGEGAGATRDLKVTAAVKGIHWTSSGFFCPLVGLGNGETGTNGEFSGVVTAKGFVDNGGPFVPGGGTDADAYTEGAQVGVFLTTP